MKLEEIEARLKDWQKRHTEFMVSYSAFRDLTDAPIDCKLLRPMINLLDAYTVTVSEIVGDKGDWLSWFANDCRMGHQPKIYAPRRGRDIRVSTLKQLARVIKDE